MQEQSGSKSRESVTRTHPDVNPDPVQLPGRHANPARRGAPAPAEWNRQVRELERKKRLAARLPAPPPRAGPFPGYFERATYVSFRLDGLQIAEPQVAQALARGAAARACRSRSAQRVRNHVAVLRHIEALLRHNHALQPAHVIRWYTSVACGLSCGRIDDQTVARIGQVVSTMNSPQLRLGPAVQEIAALHVRLLGDPFVPGFNGILARLLLRYHLGRCGLPPVLFDPEADAGRISSESALLPRLLELILERYDAAGQD